MTFAPSAYQQAIFDEIRNGTGHITVEAVAGSGKTTTLIQAMGHIPQGSRVAFVAFNRHIVEEMASKVPAGVDVMTTHQLGLKTLKAAGYRVKIDAKKLDKHMDSAMADYNRKTFWEMAPTIRKVVGFLKNTSVSPTYKGIDGVIAEYAIDLPLNVLPEDEYARYVENGVRGITQHFRADANRATERGQTIIGMDEFYALIRGVYNSTTSDTSTVDFDDMLHLPVVLGLKLQYYDYVMGDEAQDYNTVQMSLLLGSIREGGRIIVVGDSRQSIYAFRGANTDSMGILTDMLNATVLPLSISYRCPSKHIKLAREIVPYIEASSTAKEGTVVELEYEQAVAMLKPGDLVICRYNAPVIKLALRLITSGKRATVRGRDIVAMLKSMIKKFDVRTSAELLRAVEAWYKHMSELCEEHNEDVKPYHDRYETIEALVVGLPKYKTVDALMGYLDTLYSDDETPGGDMIVLSTVHGAKGLEGKDIYILFPESMPHKHPKQNERDALQEMNIKYVALTRSKENMYLVRKED